MLNILEAVPLTIFIYFVRNIDTQIPMNWRVPFIVCGMTALLITLVFIYKKIVLNRIFLGINIYLYSGAIAFITHQWWLNETYGHFQASGMIVWIIIIGVISTLLSPHGFVGADSSDRKRVRKLSIYLIMVSLCAFALSYAFRGNRLLSEIIPFVGLFTGQTILRGKTATQEAEIQG